MESTSNDEAQADYDKRVKERVKMLINEFKNGKVFLPKDSAEIQASLLAIRSGPDGEIDLKTVDGIVRSMALGIAEMKGRQQAKDSASIAEIQHFYFSFLESNFSYFYGEMTKRGLNPHDVAASLSRNQAAVSDIDRSVNKVVEHIKDFWESVGYGLHAHIEDARDCVRLSFGGDLFPSPVNSIASKCGIYADQIILPCPFMRSIHLFPRWSPEERVYFMIKHALNVLTYKNLACTEGIPPIVVILPDSTALNEDEKDYTLKLGMNDAVQHFNKALSGNFTSFDDLANLFKTLDSASDIERIVKDVSRIAFDVEAERTIKSQLETLRVARGMSALPQHAGNVILHMTASRLSICNEILLRAARLGATPMIDAPTSWQYFSWKLEYDSYSRGSFIHSAEQLHITRALQRLGSSEMPWLAKVPHDTLIQMRKEGALQEIRSLLSTGIKDISNQSPGNYFRSTGAVMDNINRAFDAHLKSIEGLQKKKWGFAIKDIGKWIGVGSIEVASACLGTPVWGLSAFVADQLLDTVKLKDIPASIKNLSNETKTLTGSPVGIMFKLSQAR